MSIPPKNENSSKQTFAGIGFLIYAITIPLVLFPVSQLLFALLDAYAGTVSWVPAFVFPLLATVVFSPILFVLALWKGGKYTRIACGVFMGLSMLIIVLTTCAMWFYGALT